MFVHHTPETVMSFPQRDIQASIIYYNKLSVLDM